LLLGILAGMAHPTTTCGSTIRDDEPDSAYVALGNDPAFASVGTLVTSLYTGCGILIAPNWVLTSAHLFTAASSATFTLNGTAYTSTQLFTDPGWNGNVYNGYDFGLVHLGSPVTAIPPAILYAGSSLTGQTGTFVGYGLTGTGLTGWHILDNQKRGFQNVIDGDFGNPANVLAADFDNPHMTTTNTFGSATPLTLEGCVAPGDSGGGVFVQNGSQYYLAGVSSFVAATDGNANSSYGDISGFDTVSSAMPWIIATIPEPSTFALAAAFGLAIFLARKYRQVEKKS
jgi:Trypsin